MSRLGLLVLLVGCNKNPVEPVSPSTGSETHWLEACDEACGHACVCGVCTAPCEADDACLVGEVDSVCALGGTPAGEALCGATPGGGGVCARVCRADADCGALVCREGVCVAPPPPAEVEPVTRRAAFDGPAPLKMDYLFVIDDSGSMCEEQAALVAGFEQVAQALWDGPDFRVAVVSTDMVARGGAFLAEPAEAVPSLSCLDADGEPATPDTVDCPELVEGARLPRVLRPGTARDVGDLARQFRCSATLGTNGDGFEKGLEAMRQALSCDGPNRSFFGSCCDAPETCDDAEFLRPDADLLVVFLSDEDDCSDDPDAPISRSENSNCEWDRDTLVPVDAYAAFLEGLKPQARQHIRVAAMVGPPALNGDGEVVHYERGRPEDPRCDPESGEYDPAATECCPGGACLGPIQPSCSSEQGETFAGHRYRELASRFGGCAPGRGCNLCTDDLAMVVADAVKQNGLEEQPLCLDGTPACVVFEGDGARGCVGAELEDPANLAMRVEVECAGPRCEAALARRALANDEWALQSDARCASGPRLVITGQLPRGTRIEVVYRTTP